MIIFTNGFVDDNDFTIISAINLIDDELNHEKENMINSQAINQRNPYMELESDIGIDDIFN